MSAAPLTCALERPSPGSERLGQLALVRIAAGGPATRSALAQDLGSIAAQRLAPAPWRARLDRQIDALIANGLVAETAAGLNLTAAGAKSARRFLGLRGQLPRDWHELREVRLVAKALGLDRLAGKELARLARPDGLRAAIVQTAFKLKIKGIATPARLRSALAALALTRAFGNGLGAGLAGKGGLPAKAARLLAGQLARSPRDFGTDSRLIAALAAEHLGAKPADIEALRRAVLSAYFANVVELAAPPVRRPLPRPTASLPAPNLTPAPVAVPPPAIPATLRPDLNGFVSEVRRQAAHQAQGWVGDRKAYISHVWRALDRLHSDWGLSEIEFKCMLVEAHRSGQLALVNADLKDKNSIKDVQESAVVYKNTVFHFVRVDG